MYCLPEMIEMADQRWTSRLHKKVAIALLIGNRRVNSRQHLIEYAGIINGLTRGEAKALTIGRAAEIGIPVN